MWAYEHLGVFGWTTEFWSPLPKAGITDYHFVNWFADHPIADDLALLRWNDDALGGPRLRRLVPVRASAARPGRDRRLGLVQRVGQRAARAHGGRDRAAQRLRRLHRARHAEAARAPRRHAPARGRRPGSCGLRSRTTAGSPTNVTEKAKEKKLVEPVHARIALPDGVHARQWHRAGRARAARRAEPRPFDARGLRFRERPDPRSRAGRVDRLRNRGRRASRSPPLIRAPESCASTSRSTEVRRSLRPIVGGDIVRRGPRRRVRHRARGARRRSSTFCDRCSFRCAATSVPTWATPSTT